MLIYTFFFYLSMINQTAVNLNNKHVPSLTLDGLNDSSFNDDIDNDDDAPLNHTYDQRCHHTHHTGVHLVSSFLPNQTESVKFFPIISIFLKGWTICLGQIYSRTHPIRLLLWLYISSS